MALEPGRVWRLSRRALLAAAWAGPLAAERPRYGGSLRIAASIPIAPLTSDPLVFFEGRAAPRAGLALRWSHDAALRRWSFDLRPGVRTHDGTELTAQALADVLTPLFGDRKWWAEGSSLIAQSTRAMPRLLAELAQPGAAIAGTGPFETAQYEAGRRATVRAFDAYWAGRPFLDAIELRFDTARTAGADVAELPPAEIRRQSQAGRRTWVSESLDLIALVFDRQRPLVQAERVRRGLAAAIDREPIANVILQKHGEPTAAILPHKISGYGFLFDRARDLGSARRQLSGVGPLLLACDPGDAVLNAIAGRIALNAREAGAIVRVADRVPADVHLRRAPGQPLDPYLALGHYAGPLGVAAPEPASTLEELFAREQTMVEGTWAVPLFHVPVIYGLSPRVRNWPSPGLPPWRFEDAWVAGEK